MVPAMGFALCACVDLGVIAASSTGGIAPPDPSIQKCIDDGYGIVHVYNESGVPTLALCVDELGKRKCESWAYYRGECRMEAGGGARPSSGSSKPEGEVAGTMRKCGVNTSAGGANGHDLSHGDEACASGTGSSDGPRLERGAGSEASGSGT